MPTLDYRIGRLVLQPHRQLLDEGQPVAIGRRALDLLSALAAANGSLVTKDELVQQVWTGAFVEDNAIQAQIVAARKALGAEADRLNTVRGLGYRLAAEPLSSAARSSPELSAAPTRIVRSPSTAVRAGRPGRLALGAGALAAAAAVVLAVALIWPRLQPRAPDVVSLQPFDTAGQAPLARSLASSLLYEVGDALSNAGVKVLGPDQSAGRSDANLILGGEVQLSGADLHLTATLESARDHAVLWSTSFTRPAAEAAAMQEQVAGKLADVLHCALDTTSYPGRRVDLGTMRLYLRACDLEHEPGSSGQVRDLYRQIVQRQPGFSLAWSRLAYRSALAAFELSPDQAVTARQEARRDAQIALRLNPRDGLAYEALADIGLGTLRFDQLHALFVRGLAVDPDNAKVLQDRGELLLRMGRIDDALADLRRANDLEPLSPDERVDIMQAWMDDGRIDLARGIAQRALRIWPDNPTLGRRLFMIEARYGDAKAARAMLASPAARGFEFSETEKDLSTAILVMREQPSAAAARDLVRRDLAAYRSGHNDLGHTMLDLSQAGAVDDAFRLADQLPVSGPSTVDAADSEFLWEPGAEALRRDPRFITLAAKLGVAEFWRRTGKWPDFCATPAWPYACKATAMKPPPLDRGDAPAV